jgi:hypothetical protein
MRTLRLLSLIAISLVIILLSTILLAQSSSSITDAVSTVAVIKAPLVKQNAAVRSLSQPDPENQAKIHESYGNLPLSFEANQGQADSRVKFLTRTGAYNMFLTGDEAVLVLRERKAKNKEKDKDKNKNKDKNKDKKNNAKEDNKFPVETRPAASPAKANSTPKPERATESILRMKLSNANANARVTGLDELAGTSNYFIGSDPAKWRSNVPTYSKVKYEAIYSGIDLVFYGNQQQLEYDFIVAPGVDPHRIAFDIRGAKRIRKDEHGDLVFKTGEGEIRWHKPVAYQEKDGARQLVAVHYAITDKNRVGFELAKYDAGRPLYIDPLIYSTFLGGSRARYWTGGDYGLGIAVDVAGNAYVTGWTWSIDFPTKNPLQPANASFYGSDAFVAKINPSGSALVYSTYLGGSDYDQGTDIAADSAGNAYVTGFTSSTNFPTKNPLQPASGGGADAFVAKINPTGSALIYSTYLGGSGDDFGNGIAADSVGNAYIAGSASSTDFPTMNPLQPTQGGSGDAFVAKINPIGSALIYSSYLGGSGGDSGSDIAVDRVGNAYVIGYTVSTDFPTMNPLQPTQGGSGDAFVAKISPTGSTLIYSTYLGGSGGDSGTGIAVDRAGNAYLIGYTVSTDFPTMKPLQPALGGGQDAFVAKINPAGSALIYSTYLGGTGDERGYEAEVFRRFGGRIAVDSAGNTYVTGTTFSFDFPTVNPLQKTLKGPTDAFISKLNSTGSALVYSTYLGGGNVEKGIGVAVDSAGNAYLAGQTESPAFPTMNALQPFYAGGGDAFVTKLYIAAGTTTTLLSSVDPSTYGQAVTFTAVVTSGLGAPPDGETVTFKKGTTILATGTLSGGSASFTTSTLRVGTNPIKAVYGGDSNYGGSTSTAVSQVVSKATTTTTLASSLNPSNVGQSVTFTASMTPQFGGTVHGTVTFYDGTTALKTMSVSGGAARFTTSTLPVGSHNITATYNGSLSFTGSSASLTQQVN